MTPKIVITRYFGDNGGTFCQPANGGFSFINLRRVPGGFDGVDEAGYCSASRSEYWYNRMNSALSVLMGRI